MKTNFRKAMLVGAGVAALGAIGRADTITQTFNQTVPLTASPTGTVSFNTVWNVNQYSGFGGLTSLTGVQYDITTQLFYQGTLVGLVSSQSFNLQVRSDFNFVLPGTTPAVTTLDPTISLTGAVPNANIPFTVPSVPPAASSIPSATKIASDLAAYVGGGTLPVTATGGLVTTSPGGAFQNMSDIGEASPYVFVDQAKVFPVFGLQQFSLVATMVVTYTVPEASTYGAVAGLVGLVGWRCWARRRKS